MSITIAAVSDTHGMWGRLNYPKADILIYAGDILRNYGSNRIINNSKQLNEIHQLNNFIGKLKEKGLYKEVVVVAGNHDYAFQDLQEARSAITNGHYLQDQEVIIDGLKLYGSPWQPWFYDWAFNFPNHNHDFLQAKTHAQGIWALIPDDTNVLVTHGPPRGILDMCYDGREVGCVFLSEKLSKMKQIKLHVFGHIHHSYGQKNVGSKIVANVAACNEAYEPENPIQVFKI